MDDERLAVAYDLASSACAKDEASCQATLSACSGTLSEVLANQRSFDEVAFVVDLDTPLNGQRFEKKPLPAPELPTVSACSREAGTMRDAALKRHLSAQRRQALADEYRRYQTWATAVFAQCRGRKGGAAGPKVVSKKNEKKFDAAAAKVIEAKALFDAEALKAEQAEEQLRALESADDERREAFELALDEARLTELRARQAASAAKVYEQTQLADAAWEEQNVIEESKAKRPLGSLGVHVAGGYLALSDATQSSGAPLFGAHLSIRQAVWFDPGEEPSGLVSGFELRTLGTFHSTPGGPTFGQAFTVMPELRFWYGRMGFGAVFEFRYFATRLAGAPSSGRMFGLGPSLSLALFDKHSVRWILSARYLPILSWDPLAVAGEMELAISYLSAFVYGGPLRDGALPDRRGWFLGVALGGRLRW